MIFQRLYATTALGLGLAACSARGSSPSPSPAAGADPQQVAAELLAADGSRLATYTLSPSAGQLIRLRIDLPPGISSGVYFVRVIANTGVDVARVVVVD